MNDDSALMPPPPPRLCKRQKLDSALSSLSLLPSLATTASVGDWAHPITIAMPPHLPRLGIAADNRVSDDFYAGASRGIGERETRSVSPEEYRKVSSTSMSSSSSGCDGRWEQDEGALVAGGIPSSTAGVETVSAGYATTSGTIQPPPYAIESSAAFGRTISDNDAGDNEERHCDAPSMQGDVPFVPSGGGGDRQSNEINECVSVLGINNGDGDGGRRDRHPRGRDSPPPIGVSFRDIIGHGQAKLRLDEALLPLALPQEIAESVLTGA